MKHVLYAAEEKFLERYLREKAKSTLDDFKAITDLWGNSIPEPGTDEAVNEIYSVDNETAHIKIEGVLSPDGPDIWDRFWGYEGVSYNTIIAAMARAQKDPIVKDVIFDINSPGGTVAGCDETWQAHTTLAKCKRTKVHAGSLLASAAYYIATPAHKIYATARTNEIGSIGVMVATYDWSKWEEEVGIREIIITSSNAPDKAPDIATKKGRDTIKSQLDALERNFYARISESRDVTTDYIAERFGKGGLLVAADPSLEKDDAVSVHMIDDILNHGYIVGKPHAGPGITEQQINEFIDVVTKETQEHPEYFSETINPAQAGTGERATTIQELMAQNPAVAVELDKIKAEARTEGRNEAKADFSAKVGRMIGVITSKSYPDNIKALAGDVLEGKKGIDAFDAAVTIHDSQKEAEKSAAAVLETETLGAVGAASPSLISTTEKELDAAMQADLERRRNK